MDANESAPIQLQRDLKQDPYDWPVQNEGCIMYKPMYNCILCYCLLYFYNLAVKLFLMIYFSVGSAI